MKKMLLFAFVALAVAVVSGCGGARPSRDGRQESRKSGEKHKRVLVAYFSATGRTAAAASRLAALTGGELFEIKPSEPYTKADIDYNDESSRCWVENRDSTLRPELVSLPAAADSADIVFIGYPIWWEKAPLPVYTFVERAALSGKTLIPFATSATSTISQSAAALRRLRGDVTWKDGILMNGLTDNLLSERLAGLYD